MLSYAALTCLLFVCTAASARPNLVFTSLDWCRSKFLNSRLVFVTPDLMVYIVSGSVCKLDCLVLLPPWSSVPSHAPCAGSFIWYQVCLDGNPTCFSPWRWYDPLYAYQELWKYEWSSGLYTLKGSVDSSHMVCISGTCEFEIFIAYVRLCVVSVQMLPCPGWQRLVALGSCCCSASGHGTQNLLAISLTPTSSL